MELKIKTYRLDDETIYLIEKYTSTYKSKGRVIAAAMNMLHRAERDHVEPVAVQGGQLRPTKNLGALKWKK